MWCIINNKSWWSRKETNFEEGISNQSILVRCFFGIDIVFDFTSGNPFCYTGLLLFCPAVIVFCAMPYWIQKKKNWKGLIDFPTAAALVRYCTVPMSAYHRLDVPAADWRDDLISTVSARSFLFAHDCGRCIPLEWWQVCRQLYIATPVLPNDRANTKRSSAVDNIGSNMGWFIQSCRQRNFPRVTGHNIGVDVRISIQSRPFFSNAKFNRYR